MDRVIIALLVCVTILTGLLSQLWVSWLEHKRRLKAMDLLKAHLDAGRTPPEELYDELAGRSRVMHERAPVVELVVFGAMSVAFWVGYVNSLNAGGEGNSAYLVVATAMSVATIVCLAVLVLRTRRRSDDQG